MFVQVSVQILILLLSKKYTESPTTGGFETIFDSSGAFGMILYIYNNDNIKIDNSSAFNF